ncbi:MAG: ribonuclease III [Brumimicrobium sp.]
MRWFSFQSRPKNKNELQLIKFLIKKFGYRPKNLKIFKTALTHKSISNVSKGLESNERLEFLGDTILDAVIADILYEKFPDKNEGYLTKVKSKLVSRKTLSMVAKKMEIGKNIYFQKGRGINVHSLEGNALESLIGAIYLDGGFKTVKKSITHSILRNYLNIQDVLENEIDFKSQLYIWAQRNKINIEFNLMREELIKGEWNYEVEVLLNSIPHGRGKGNTKKMAEQSACKQTLELIG